MVTKRMVATIKRRTDRGGIYMAYLSMIITGGTFMKVFGVTKWYWYILAAVLLFVLRYLAGYVEEKKGILGAEQRGYSELNPEWGKMMDKLDKIAERCEK